MDVKKSIRLAKELGEVDGTAAKVWWHMVPKTLANQRRRDAESKAVSDASFRFGKDLILE